MLPVTFRQIEYAAAVHDQGGVTAAAQLLGVSQPALSVAIAQLEKQLGRPLFIRHKGHGITTTSFGQIFMRDAKQLVDRARALLDQAKDGSTATGNVAIGCFEDLAPSYLASLLRGFSREFPGIAISVRDAGFSTLAHELEQGVTDVALTYDLGLGAHIARRLLATVKPHAVVPASHRFASRKSITLKQLASEPLILSDQALSWQHILELFRSKGIEARIGTRVGSYEVLRSFVANGLGVSVSYVRPSVDQSYDGKKLRLLDIVDSIPSQRIVLAYAKANPPTVAADALVKYTMGMFERKQGGRHDKR